MAGAGAVANEKETMQDLNERLATYLEKVRSLEQENRRLELQIRDFAAKKGPSARDWSHYWEVIEELRDKVGAPREGGGASGTRERWHRQERWHHQERWHRGVKH